MISEEYLFIIVYNQLKPYWFHQFIKTILDSQMCKSANASPELKKGKLE